MITHTGGKVNLLEEFLNNLCQIILKDEGILEVGLAKTEGLGDFSVSNDEHLRKLDQVLKEVADKIAIQHCITYLRKNKNCEVDTKEKLLNFISQTEKMLNLNQSEQDKLMNSFKLESVTSNFPNSTNKLSMETSSDIELKNEDTFKIHKKVQGTPSNILSLKKIFQNAKDDPNFLLRKNPFDDPLYFLTQETVPARCLEIADNNTLSKILKKTILNNVVKNYLEKNKLIGFRMKVSRKLRRRQKEKRRIK
jgi:hypothetical protein